MSTRRIIGIVMGVTGALISLGHLILMVFTNLLERYHGFETWVAIGFFLAVIGIILIGKDT